MCICIEKLSFLKTPLERGENFRSPDIYIFFEKAGPHVLAQALAQLHKIHAASF